MHLLPPQAHAGAGPILPAIRARAVQGPGRTQAMWEIPACQRQARSGDRVLRKF